MSYNNNISPLDSQKLNERVTALENNTGSTDNGPIYVAMDGGELQANFEVLFQLKKAEVESGQTLTVPLEHRVLYKYDNYIMPPVYISYTIAENNTLDEIEYGFINAGGTGLEYFCFNTRYIEGVFDVTDSGAFIDWPE